MTEVVKIAEISEYSVHGSRKGFEAMATPRLIRSNCILFQY